MMKYAILAAAAAAPFANAQAQVWGQCGGLNYSGPKTCASGSSCVVVNDWYHQCQPGAAPVTSAPATSSSVRPTSSTSARGSSSSNSATKTSSSASGGSSTTPPPAQGSGNPLAGYSFYNNPYYASEIINLAAPSLSAKGSAAWAAKATNVAKIGTFAWLDTRAKVPTIKAYAEDVKKRNAAGEKLTLPLVVYDLPNRDCAAKASNGELDLANDGANLYKGYIDSIKAIIQAYPEVHFTLVIEPDSLANLITNMNVAKCQVAGPAYRELTIYAMKTLNLPNVVMYLDAGHAGWLGWEANLPPAAKLYGSIYVDAGKPAAVRGLAVNVANYNAWSIATCPAYAESNKNCDEKRYINALAPLLAAEGFPAHFIQDTSRSGVQPTKQQAWGDWCNVIGTGFGIRPSTKTDDPLLDAWAWVKPGGESDGTSDTSATRYDEHCGYPDALKPAPEAGTWFQAYFEQLLVNAKPAF